MDLPDSYLGALDWLGQYLLPSDATIHLIQVTLTCAALTWLLYRAWQVLRIPVPELIDLLGLEVPSVPEVSLAGIEADSITLHWIGRDRQSTIVKHLIKVNGITVGESSRTETAITVSGLKPDHFYGVRVVAVNASNFQTASGLIRLKTLGKDEQGTTTATAGSPARSGSSQGRSTAIDGESRGDTLVIRAHSHPAELPHPAIANTAAGKDQTRGNHQGRRAPNTRKFSPLNAPIASSTSSHNHLGAGEAAAGSLENEATVEQLTERLEAIRRETKEIQALKKKEEEEFQATKSSLIYERDRLRQSLRERDDASAELRREVASLERQNRIAQSNKTAKEKILQQKQNEREKMRQDMDRWKRGAIGYREEAEKLENQKQDLVRDTQAKVAEAREQINEWQKSIKEMEEDIRVKGAKIKEFEQERRKLQVEEENAEVVERERRAKEEDARREHRLRDLQAMYAKLSLSVQQALESYRQAQERLAWWAARGITNPVQFATMSAQDLEALMPNRPRQRKMRQNKSRSTTKSSLVDGFPIDPRHSSSSILSGPSLFNVNNGTASHATSERINLSKEDVDQLTTGARMSPRADSLLPSDLLGDDEGPSARRSSFGANLPNPAFRNSAYSSLALPALDAFLQDPNSPDSAGSRAASMFPSPRDSLHHLPTYRPAADLHADGDHASPDALGAEFGVIGEPANGATISPRRLANLFNLNRQRGKTLDAQPPVLGALKSGQSQSFPRKWDEPPGELDPIGTKRRRGSHSTSWISPMTNFNFLGRSGLAVEAREGSSDASPKVGLNRRKPFNMFGSKIAPLNVSNLLAEPTSPRPASVSSFENALPRPSSDSQPFGWPVQPSNHFGADWSVQSNEPWSHGPSRRSSAQYGSTSSLSLGITTLEAESGANSLSMQNTPPAAIGTRPRSSQKGKAPRLNPAAPSFKTLFSRTEAKRAEKAEKVEKAAEEEREKEKERERDKDFDLINEETTSATNRNSRDTRSIHTEDSVADSRDSMDRPASTTASESVTPSGNSAKDRESIFQKISRKSSSSKFNVPWKDRGIRSNKKAVEASTPGEVDDDSTADLQLGRSVDSVTSSPSLSGGKGGLTWSTLMRKAKVEEKAMAEATDTSRESVEDEDSGP